MALIVPTQFLAYTRIKQFYALKRNVFLVIPRVLNCMMLPKMARLSIVWSDVKYAIAFELILA